MKIKFRYSKNDYIELLLSKNSDNTVIKRSKLFYKIILPLLIIILFSLVWEAITPNYLVVLIISMILIIFWLIFSGSIYDHNQRRMLLKLADKELTNNIEYIKDTTITLTDDGIIKEIEGMYSKLDWSFVNTILVTNNNIFINLISNGIINIPKRIFNSPDEESVFLKYIDERININTGLQIDDSNISDIDNY
ncbi:YcxB family protein [Clostridium sp.]|uniref:YcxB family protein n=1 Tax=Clostridium sp. TaxID=1506 RepID=UPI003F2BE988